MSPCLIPPIKSQGIKSKLVSCIQSILAENSLKCDVWIEPFCGTGVVALNIKSPSYILADINPHLIHFYKSLQDKNFSHVSVKKFLVSEAEKFTKIDDYYYIVRDRFNKDFDPLDFLLLNRSCFNGIIRFNKKGEFNVPFCKKKERFRAQYITKISNQVKIFEEFLSNNNVVLMCSDFRNTFEQVHSINGKIVYCDPPYIDRHTDYYNNWSEKDEYDLFDLLSAGSSNFLLSTWHHNKYRHNKYIDMLWKKFFVYTTEHFYHVGANEKNRSTMFEAIISNINLVFNYSSKQKRTQAYLI